ncbi:MAG: hypothetical protein CM15mP25_4330 [Gammaproteobacteria bacterium]|nr:MAG: hypothetical protein CM15mP25_4330 [Gammaproteobacteria bacterium]
MVSNAERAARVEAVGGAAVDRKTPLGRRLYLVPDDPRVGELGKRKAQAFRGTEAAAGGSVDYVVSHAGRRPFPAPSSLGEGAC